NKIAKLVGAKSVTIEKNILKVTMPDGTVYARPLSASFFPYGVTPSGLLTGGNGYTNDVLFGGNGNDTLMEKDGSDLLIGGNGDDTYLATKGDTIKDSDGKGSVHFNGHKLTGGTYDKDRDLYISDDYIEYKLHDDGRLVVSDMGENIVIENFNKDNNDLGIILIDPKDVVVTIHDNQANEGGNGKHSMEFKITPNRALKKDEFLELIINGQRVKFKEADIEQTYTHTWDGNTIKEEDRKFKVSASVVTDKSIVKARLAQAGNETIIDHDREFTNLNLLVA
ncbi:MAG: calcium-binding protein, partial [Campylobacter ureolyticus]